MDTDRTRWGPPPAPPLGNPGGRVPPQPQWTPPGAPHAHWVPPSAPPSLEPRVGSLGRVTGGLVVVFNGLALLFLLLGLLATTSEEIRPHERETLVPVLLVATALAAGMVVLGVALCASKPWARTTLIILLTADVVVRLIDRELPNNLWHLILASMLVIDWAQHRAR